MNATMIDVTPFCDQVKNGDQVVIISKQGNEEITADDIWKSATVEPWTLHYTVGQLNYENRFPKKLAKNRFTLSNKSVFPEYCPEHG